MYERVMCRGDALAFSGASTVQGDQGHRPTNLFSLVSGGRGSSEHFDTRIAWLEMEHAKTHTMKSWALRAVPSVVKCIFSIARRTKAMKKTPRERRYERHYLRKAKPSFGAGL